MLCWVGCHHQRGDLYVDIDGDDSDGGSGTIDADIMMGLELEQDRKRHKGESDLDLFEKTSATDWSIFSSTNSNPSSPSVADVSALGGSSVLTW
jgi:hypothetical protein